MTNNENIKLIRELYDYAMWDFHKGNLDEMTNKDVAVGKAIDNVEKDLEVLEILKPHLINAGIGKYDNVSDYELLHLKLSLSGKEYNTIKEWIENETKIAECGSATTISTQADKPLIVEVKTPDEFIIYNEENKNDK